MTPGRSGNTTSANAPLHPIAEISSTATPPVHADSVQIRIKNTDSVKFNANTNNDASPSTHQKSDKSGRSDSPGRTQSPTLFSVSVEAQPSNRSRFSIQRTISSASSSRPGRNLSINFPAALQTEMPTSLDGPGPGSPTLSSRTGKSPTSHTPGAPDDTLGQQHYKLPHLTAKSHSRMCMGQHIGEGCLLQ